MRSAVKLTVLAVIAAAVSGTGPARALSGVPTNLPTGCVPAADAASAGAALFGHEVDVASVGEVGGFRSASVLVPELVMPGVHRRVIDVGAAWCDARGAFNAAWQLTGRTGSAVERASSFAAVAGAPFFDDITVRSATLAAPGQVNLETHAKTNGVVARWTIAVDQTGVREASWRATEIFSEPFEASVEGLTALPGATRSFARAASGMIDELSPITASSSADPQLETLQASAVMSDGFVVEVRHGGGPLGVTLTEDTGYETVDFARLLRDGATANYEDFLSWGLHGGWRPSDRGVISIDGPLALACFACVLISQQFNVHLSSQVVAYLEASGYKYPDHDGAAVDILGHEIFHNFQNVYTGAGSSNNRRMTGAFTEGLARFQETLHDYSAVSHQPQSLIYARNINGCNGYIGNGGMGSSVADHLYDACYFWMGIYADHGVAGLTRMVESSSANVTLTDWPETKSVISAGTAGQPLAETLAAFASDSLTRPSYSWGAADGSSSALDWSIGLNSWSLTTIFSGQVRRATLAPGGMMGVRIPAAGGTVSATSSASPVSLFRIDGDGTVSAIESGSAVTPTCVPVSEFACAVQDVWVVAINASDTKTYAAISLA